MKHTYFFVNKEKYQKKNFWTKLRFATEVSLENDKYDERAGCIL